MSKSIVKNFSLSQPIVLIGMMGAGKTTIGRAVAALLAAPFFDADLEIEKAAGRSVAEIFSDYGESEFRRLERQVVSRLLDGDPCVLSLGGGAFIDEETRERVMRKSLSVWLDVDEDILLERIQRPHSRRPLLGSENPKEKFMMLLSERIPFYSRAHLTVHCGNVPVARNARHVVDVLGAFLKEAGKGLKLT